MEKEVKLMQVAANYVYLPPPPYASLDLFLILE
jgi:hypothetical protein